MTVPITIWRSLWIRLADAWQAKIFFLIGCSDDLWWLMNNGVMLWIIQWDRSFMGTEKKVMDKEACLYTKKETMEKTLPLPEHRPRVLRPQCLHLPACPWELVKKFLTPSIELYLKNTGSAHHWEDVYTKPTYQDRKFSKLLTVLRVIKSFFWQWI